MELRTPSLVGTPTTNCGSVEFMLESTKIIPSQLQVGLFGFLLHLDLQQQSIRSIASLTSQTEWSDILAISNLTWAITRQSSERQLTGHKWVTWRSRGDSLEVPEGFVGGGTPDVVQLRHPQTGAPAMFLFSPGDGMVQEVLTFSENRRSWFIDESVKSDGKMHLSTPIDPIFLVLPYLRKASQVMPLEQILKDEEFPETERLLHAAGLKHLTQVADRRGDDELCAYKYNEEKALSWLQRKAERVAEVLKQKGIAVSSGAMSANFVKSCSKQDADTGGVRAVRSTLKYAHGMLSEYLPEDLSLKLGQQMSLPEDCHPASSKRKLAVGGNSNNMQGDVKKVRAELDLANGGVLDLTKPEKSTKSVSSKDKARAKVASGSKTISTFFKKK
uniref:Ribonuclease H2 subunit B n=1 Tax=Timema douglasi TaxID=61478 RepID=A0A7R8ZAC0_TIMDO|nr:unnamed protein product [Timema douglasi]